MNDQFRFAGKEKPVAFVFNPEAFSRQITERSLAGDSYFAGGDTLAKINVCLFGIELIPGIMKQINRAN